MADPLQADRESRLDPRGQRSEKSGGANEPTLAPRGLASHRGRCGQPRYRAGAGVPDSPPLTAVLTIALYRSASARAFSESSMLTMMW